MSRDEEITSTWVSSRIERLCTECLKQKVISHLRTFKILLNRFPVALTVSCFSEEAHLEAGHMESAVYLRLWSGDLQGALQLATERGELNDHLLSVAPLGECHF